MTLRFAGAALALGLAFSTSALFAACSGTGTGATNGSGGGTPGGTGGAGSGHTSSGNGAGGDDGGPLFDAAGSGSGAGGGGDAYLIYAHTNTTLFTLDPTSPKLPLVQIGDFDCIGNGPGQVTAMTDVAVDANQNIWAVSSFALHPITVQGSAVKCGAAIKLNDPNLGDPNLRYYALSFAPVGVLDPAKEVLVAGNTAGELWSIDSGGNTKQHGVFGTVPMKDPHGNAYKYPGTAWELSGDIVFLANKGKPVGFATVRDCPSPPSATGCNKVNTLIEIDMTAFPTVGKQNVTKTILGQILERPGCNDGLAGDYGAVYGVASWNDHVYGFARKSGDGNLIDININDATACLVQTYTGDAWAGAGVTTLAPVIPPPN